MLKTTSDALALILIPWRRGLFGDQQEEDLKKTTHMTIH